MQFISNTILFSVTMRLHPSSAANMLQVQDHLNAMPWAMMKVFHWHTVDDQSFPFESHHLPDVSADNVSSGVLA